MKNKNKEYKRVNWINGMKVRFDMFEQTEDYYTGALCDSMAVHLNRNNFGLLPSFDGRSNSSEFEISEKNTGTVEVILRRCNAVTLGGCRISYNPLQGESMTFSQKINIDEAQNTASTIYWDIVITADPFHRIPSGIPDGKETPPRHPDVDSYYRLSMTPKGQLNPELLGMFHMVIGRVRQIGSRYEVDADFVPPCTSMSSHIALKRYYDLFGSLINDIENSSQLIIAKVRNRSQNAPVALHIASLCEDMMRYIAGLFPFYRNSAMDDSPVNVVNNFSALARVCYSSMSFISKTDKEELLRYFYEWSDITPGSFDELLSGTCNIAYNHNDIRAVMVRIESFLRVISELWTRLSGLEYIGKQKDSVIISERVQIQEQPKKTGSWTVFD